MRVEPYGVGSLVHIIQRGARGSDIVNDQHDKDRFVRSLFYLNEKHSDSNWHRTTAAEAFPERPSSWPEREPLVRVLGWTLLSNHFHLLLQEHEEAGIAKFMQRLCGSMTKCFNAKYGGQGSLFQGSYKARTVTTDAQRQYIAFYVLVKNVLDMYPGGLRAAERDFDDAWEWAMHYPYSSFRDFVQGSEGPVIEDKESLVSDMVSDPSAYKSEARELLQFHLQVKGGDLASVMLEPW